jgi:acyl carrier protein
MNIHEVRMSDSSTLSRLTPLLRETFNDELLVATPELKASDVREWDSIGQVRLFFEIEREFSVRFSSTEINSLKTVGQIADAIEMKIAGS